MIALIVIAKQPRPGASKTRLCPPCTPEQAAAIAAGALHDTLDVVARTPCARRILCLEGEPGDWMPDGFEVIPQRGEGLDERLGAAFADVGEPAVLIAMDTPQITVELLSEAMAELEGADVDAVIGPASDGGYWLIGLSDPHAPVTVGVPMSSDQTCRAQLERMQELGLRVSTLPTLSDVDTFSDALAIADLIPGSRFATAVGAAGPWTSDRAG